MQFYKYQGAGNDFIVFDARPSDVPVRFLTAQQRQRLCDRRLGVGADGIMLLANHPDYDFEMVYYNADGHLGSMCGNGGRCIVAFANQLGIFPAQQDNSPTYRFLAADGLHEACLLANNQVELSMQNVLIINELSSTDFVLNTGSPHYVRFVEDVQAEPFIAQAKSIRYSDQFAEKGINVNFVSSKNGQLHIRTYERGVEDETLACGTGVTAAAICWAIRQQLANGSLFNYEIQALGGQLTVTGKLNASAAAYTATQLWLSGPATLVYQGDYPTP